MINEVLQSSVAGPVVVLNDMDGRVKEMFIKYVGNAKLGGVATMQRKNSGFIINFTD